MEDICLAEGRRGLARGNRLKERSDGGDGSGGGGAVPKAGGWMGS